MLWFLPLLVTFPLIGMVIVFSISSANERSILLVALNTTLACFYIALCLWINFDYKYVGFQFLVNVPIVSFLNINCTLGIDGFSLLLIMLTTFLIPICILTSWQTQQHLIKETRHQSVKIYVLLFLMLEIMLLLLFTTLDLVVYFFAFESLLLPIYYLIGIFGSQSRKIRASYYLALYTILGSIFFLVVLVFLINETSTTNLVLLLLHDFTCDQQRFIWLFLFLSFAIKIPVIPLHIWLPEAHVQAPTTGSVLLAGILLKLGIYGLVRFAFLLFPEGTIYFTPLGFTLALVSVVYSSFTTLRQVDIKRIIAYSSVSHMGFGLLGLFSNNFIGLQGALFILFTHGVVSSALFIAIGVLYDRYANRLIFYYGGLASVMPFFSTILFLLVISNMAIPGTCCFVSELLILVGIFQINVLVAIVGALSLVLGAAYSLLFYNRACFGNLKTQYIKSFVDLTYRESFILSMLTFIIFWMGLKPDFFMNPLTSAVLFILN